MLRWLTTNLRIFLLAFALALAVWVTAVTAADPDETQLYPTPIPIQYIGQDPGLILTGTVPQQVQVTLRTPRSLWDKLLSGEASIHAVVDLTGLGSGTHTVNVQIQISIRPVRIVSVTPQTVELSLEQLVSSTLPVELTVTGEPAIGYKTGDVVLDPVEAVASGPASVMAHVKHIHAILDLTDARQSIETSLPLVAVGENNSLLSDVIIHPDHVQVTLPLVRQTGFRDLGVIVVTVGSQASGYRVNNVVSFPPSVTVYSENIALIENLPGYVKTTPLSLSGASGNIETQLSLDLPAGVILVGDQTVSVQVEIVPILGNLPVSYCPVEVIGLEAGLKAQLSPTTIDMILFGPLPVLNLLQPADIHAQIDLTGLAAGTHQLTPTVIIAKQDVTVQSILPGKVEVIIANASTPTP